MLAAVALALPVTPPALAAEYATGQAASVTVFPAHYASGGRIFRDLDTLDAAMTAVRPESIRLEACGPASARPLLAAAHRFRNARLDMRVSDDDAPPCRVGARMPAGLAGAVAARSGGDTTDPVERYWREVMP